MKIIPLATSLLIIFLCSYKPNHIEEQPNSQNPEKFFEIRYEDLIKNKQTISLTQIASKVEYIKLETNPNCVLWSAEASFFTDSIIFIVKQGTLLKFAYNGNFIGEILKIGRGPGEIDPAGGISIIPSKNLIVSQKNSQRKLLYFNYDGEFIRSVNYPSNVHAIHTMNDGRFIYYQMGSAGNSEYSFILSSEKLDTISSIKNFNYWKNTSNIAINTYRPGFRPFYYLNGRIFIKTLYNDTVYTVSSNKIIPSYYINLGKKKIPDELLPERILPNSQGNNLQQKLSNYLYTNALEASNRIFLGTYSYQAAKIPPQYFLFDKSTKKGYALINKDGEPTRIINDWDGGSDFWPVDNITDNKIFMPINIADLKKAFDTNKSIKFPKMQKELAEMIAKSDITDNPILMIITLKSSSE